MTRQLLATDNIESDALQMISNYHNQTVKEVTKTVESNKVVIVGMAHNPFVFKARKALKEAGVDFKYLEYGSYFSAWIPRLAIKLWSGWPTFPQVFVDGKLIGGFKETQKALSNGKIK